MTFPLSVFIVNKHKPWIETTYHGIITENDDKVLLDPPLIALDKDAPLRYAGEIGGLMLLLFLYSLRFTSLGIVLFSFYIKKENRIITLHQV